MNKLWNDSWFADKFWKVAYGVFCGDSKWLVTQRFRFHPGHQRCDRVTDAVDCRTILKFYFVLCRRDVCLFWLESSRRFDVDRYVGRLHSGCGVRAVAQVSVQYVADPLICQYCEYTMRKIVMSIGRSVWLGNFSSTSTSRYITTSLCGIGTFYYVKIHISTFQTRWGRYSNRIIITPVLHV